jgi:hypothetical protein
MFRLYRGAECVWIPAFAGMTDHAVMTMGMAPASKHYRHRPVSIHLSAGPNGAIQLTPATR